MTTLEKKIQKKVDEINNLISLASNSESDNAYDGNLMVTDTSSTWEEPAIYKPIIFRNGVLYIEYFEPYSNRTKKDKILKRNLEFDGYGTLLDIAKIYRRALKKENIKYAGGGEFMTDPTFGNFQNNVYADGGVTNNYVSRRNLNTITIKKGNQKLTYKISDVLNGAYKLESGAKIEDIAFYVPKRSVVKVQLKSGQDFKPANGYWIKDGAKPIHITKFYEGGVMSRLLTRKKDQPKVETINEEIDLNEDSRIRVRPSSFVRNKKEADWMMEKNSSKEARAYSQGGTIQLGGKLHYYDDLYLDYVNNFISVQAFADHYGISKEKANKIIDLGRENNTSNDLSNMKLALLTELWFAVQQKDVSEYPKIKNQLSKYGIKFAIQNKISENAHEHRGRKALSISEVHDKVTKIWNEYYKSEKSYAGGGKVTFSEKAKAIAKNFEGKRVEPKYQKEYGKVYDSKEAKEVGNKIAGSQKAKYDAKLEKGSEVKKKAGNPKMKATIDLAKKIRKDGEKWTDAVKRASLQLK